MFGKKIGPMPSFTHEIGSLDQSDRRLIFPVILFPVRAQTIQHQRERGVESLFLSIASLTDQISVSSQMTRE